MSKLHSICKVIIVLMFVATSIYINWHSTGPQASINGIIAGIALIQTYVLFEYEMKVQSR